MPTPTELQELGRLMEQVSPLLKENPDDPDVRAAIDAYTDNLRQVRGLLEGLQTELTAHRDDLRSEWQRLQAAAAWGGSIRQMR